MQGAARHDLLLTGRQALAEAEWEKARECFERALELGDGPDAMDGLAQALQWVGQYDAAIAMREAAFPAYRRQGLALEACDQARALAFLHGAVHGNEAAASGWSRGRRACWKGSRRRRNTAGSRSTELR